MLWLILSIAFMLLGFSIDWRYYFAQFSMIQNPFNLIQSMYQKMIATVPEFPSFDVKNAGDFFRYCGEFFKYLGSVISVGAVLLVYVPYQFIVFALHFVVCVIGIDSMRPLEFLLL